MLCRVALGEQGSETIERAVPSTLADRTEYSGGGDLLMSALSGACALHQPTWAAGATLTARVLARC